MPLESDLSLAGWAVNPAARNAGSAIEVAIDGRAFSTDDRLPLYDVAQAFSVLFQLTGGLTANHRR